MVVRNWIFTASLTTCGVGFWLAWPPLGLIVPSLIVLSLLVASQIFGGADVKPVDADDS